ncbi:MAG: hypothetical protein JWP76_5588 [Dactylosporangium sp.]|nr:hypothetical protein [Dactylosporangium sp.]
MPSSRNTSAPGRIGTYRSAARAVRLRRGSTTTNRPPRSRSAFSRPGASGTVHRLPLDEYGSAPRINRKSVRSMSGTGIAKGPPNRYPHETCLGIWSRVEAV